MAYSFTEKKRIRKNFGKLPPVLDVPYLLSIQLDSYRGFLQRNVPAEERIETGPAFGVQQRLPHRQLFRERRAGVHQLPTRRTGFRCQGSVNFGD